MAELRSRLTPRNVLLGITALLLVALLFAPTARQSNRSRSATSFSTDPDGARGLYEVLDRLGFAVKRWLRPLRAGLSSDAVYVVVSPSLELTASEVHTLLEAVRAGAGLLVRVNERANLADSLGMGSSAVLLERSTPPRLGRDSAGMFVTPFAYALRRYDTVVDSSLPTNLPAGARILETRTINDVTEPITIGYALGRGRVVVFADPNAVRNSRVRQGDAAVQMVRNLEWLSENRPRTIWFDEYHHGFGRHTDVFRASGRGLVGTAPGRAFLQLALAGLVLLVALAIRPIAPRPLARIERRSALEHVDALARAYSAVRARELAARLLVRGLRRRHQAVRSKADEAAYLSALREYKPELSGDIDQVARWLRGERAQEGLSELSGAISRIERGLIP